MVLIPFLLPPGSRWNSVQSPLRPCHTLLKLPSALATMRQRVAVGALRLLPSLSYPQVIR